MTPHHAFDLAALFAIAFAAARLIHWHERREQIAMTTNPQQKD